MKAERLAEIRERAAQKNPMQAEWVSLGKDEAHDLLDHIAAQDKRIAELEAGRVVVPEPTHAEFLDLAASAHVSGDLVDFMAGAAAYGIWLRGKVCAIPADRVLGDGQVAVDRERLRILERISTVVGLATGEDHPSRRWPMLAELWAEFDALRAQAGKDGG